MNHYDILGVAVDAKPKVIKKAFHELARAHHPDRHLHRDGDAMFKRVQEAYEVLSDPAKRVVYNNRMGLGERRKGSRHDITVASTVSSAISAIGRALKLGSGSSSLASLAEEEAAQAKEGTDTVEGKASAAAGSTTGCGAEAGSASTTAAAAVLHTRARTHPSAPQVSSIPAAQAASPVVAVGHPVNERVVQGVLVCSAVSVVERPHEAPDGAVPRDEETLASNAVPIVEQRRAPTGTHDHPRWVLQEYMVTFMHAPPGEDGAEMRRRYRRNAAGLQWQCPIIVD